eukprot:scaffold20452_cov150-Skeletonema_marinoi.AAC.18
MICTFPIPPSLYRIDPFFVGRRHGCLCVQDIMITATAAMKRRSSPAVVMSSAALSSSLLSSQQVVQVDLRNERVAHLETMLSRPIISCDSRMEQVYVGHGQIRHNGRSTFSLCASLVLSTAYIQV